MFTGSSQTSDHLVSLLQFRGLPLNTGIMVGCTWYKSLKKNPGILATQWLPATEPHILSCLISSPFRNLVPCFFKPLLNLMVVFTLSIKKK